MEEKKKEPVFIRGVELVDLDDCDIPDRKLQCDSTDLDNDKGPNADAIRVRDGPGSCSQTMDANDELASRSVAPRRVYWASGGLLEGVPGGWAGGRPCPLCLI
jgi:hypothetical protein